MKWPWTKRPVPPAIPPYQPVVREPVEPTIIVDEVDTTDMTRTGIHRAWDKLSGKFKGD